MIGLEIHVYLVTKEKLFCQCLASREKGLAPNTYICPICTGQPGAKPMLPNKTAVGKAVQIALMLGCKVNNNMPWQRKHYSWPDLPKGYQNTLSGPHASPVGENGKFCGITIQSMHLEEDPAAWSPKTGEVDYNRSGLPLVEIVTAPDFSTAEEVIDWLTKLTHNLAYLKAADTNAGIKVDVNVSLPKKTVRTEVKNISSLESIEHAINAELERHARELPQEQETRRFDDAKGKTTLMRSKEGAQDYRFIRDPDLQTLQLNKEFIQHHQTTIPESPQEKLEKMIKQFKIDKKNAHILIKHIDIALFFESVAHKIDPQFALPWVTIELLRVLNYHKTTLDQVDIKTDHFVALLKLVQLGTITPLKAKEMLNDFYPKSSMPIAMDAKITDEHQIMTFAKRVIEKNQEAVKSYQNGEHNALNFLLGQLMQLSNKRADPVVARKVLLTLLA